MDHKKYKEWIALSLYGELTSDEQEEFSRHLKSCEQCRIEIEKQKKLMSALNDNSNSELNEKLLREARQELRNALRLERSDKTLRTTNRIGRNYSFSGLLKFAAAGAFFILIGMFIGYLFFNTGSSNQVQNQIAENILPADRENMRIGSLNFIDSDASDGQIEFTFDLIKPVVVKGNINDSEIQNILAYAMVNEQNPGVRLNSINAIGLNVPKKLDNEVKSALLLSAKYDSNPGVRLEAVKVLNDLPYDKDIQDALVYILMNDSSSGIRIETINSIRNALKKGHTFTEDELSEFKNKIQADENNYVRYQVNQIIKEN